MDQKILSWKAPALYRPHHPLWKFLIVANVTYAGLLVMMDLMASIIVMRQVQGIIAVDYDRIIWMARGVMFCLAISPLFALRIARIYGYKKAYFFGASLFLTGCVFTGLSNDYIALIASRILTGIGGGFISSLGIPIINHTIEEVKNRRPIVAAHSSVSFGLGIALGMILGGTLGQETAWKLVFLSNLYFVPPVLLLILLCHPETPRKEQAPFDMIGFLSLTAALLSLLFIISQVKSRWNTLAWNSHFVLYCALISTTCFLIFLWNSTRQRMPIFDLSLFTHTPFFMGCLSMLATGFMVFGVTLDSIGIVQNIYGYEWVRLGWFMSIVGFIYFFVGIIPSLTIRYIDPRIYIILGMSLIAYGCMMAQSLTIQSDRFQIWTVVAVRSVGVSLSLGPIAVYSLSIFEGDSYAKGATLIQFVRMLGAVFGSALIGLIAAYRRPFHFLRFSEMVDIESAQYRRSFAELFRSMTEKGSSPSQGFYQSKEYIINWIASQADLAGILDAEYILGWVVTIMLLLFATGMFFRFIFKWKAVKSH